MSEANSLVRQKEGAQGEKDTKNERSKKGRSNRNFDTRRGRSHKFNSARGVGCEEQEKT